LDIRHPAIVLEFSKDLPVDGVEIGFKRHRQSWEGETNFFKTAEINMIVLLDHPDSADNSLHASMLGSFRGKDDPQSCTQAWRTPKLKRSGKGFRRG